MKILRIVTVVIFVITASLFALFYVDSNLNTDNTYPTIKIEESVIDVSIHDGYDKLLAGVTAYDEKDGDLTDNVIVESISQFSSEGVCTVTYAVTDNDRHVAKNTRKIQYTDYESPHFVLHEPMIFTVGHDLDIRSAVGAVDCIDGDISDRIIVATTDYQSNTAGVFSITLQATNSKGDIIYLDIPIYVEETNLRAPKIELTEYLIYSGIGEEPDFESYISDMTSDYYNVEESALLISENFNKDIPGIYSVHYYVLDSAGNEGHTVLTVVVEE